LAVADKLKAESDVAAVVYSGGNQRRVLAQCQAAHGVARAREFGNDTA